jgi:hypothetical protein
LAAPRTSGSKKDRNKPYLTEENMPPSWNSSLAIPQAEKFAKTGMVQMMFNPWANQVFSQLCTFYPLQLEYLLV